MKMLGWFGKLLASALLLSFLSVFTTVYIVDRYIQGFLSQWNLPSAERESFDIGDYISSLTDAAQLWERSAVRPEKAGQGPSLHPSLSPSPEALEASAPGQGGSKAEAESGEMSETHLPPSPSDPAASEEALPVFGNMEAAKLGDALVMSAEEFNEKRKQLTDEDKMEIFSIMITRVPQEEFQRLSLMLEEGITEAEAKELEDVINAYLHKEEVARLLAILNKY